MEDTRNDEMYSEFIMNIHSGWGGCGSQTEILLPERLEVLHHREVLPH